MRLIFDCNILVSALLSNTSVSGKALLKAKSSSALLLLSSATLAEAIEVLMRPKFDRYISKEIRQSFLEELIPLCTKVEISERITLCRDPKDDMYFELALSGNADFIITGDSDLLTLHPFKNTSVISPKDFLEL